MALRAPGFAGVWVDDKGDVRISSAQPELTVAMRREAAQYLRGQGRPELANKKAVIHRVGFDYGELYDYFQTARSLVGRVDGVSAFSINPLKGRVVIGVDNGSTQQQVITTLGQIGAPEGVWFVEVLEPTPDVGLQTRHDNMMGGLQVSGPEGFCSLGFIGFKKDPQTGYADYNRRMVTTAAHCTSNQLSLFSDWWGQPGSLRTMGYSVDLAPVYSNCYGVYTYCRYADIAIVELADSVGHYWGVVAKSSVTSDPNDPPYNGYQSYTGSGVANALVNELVTKVGRTTGQTSGRVDDDCVDRESSTTPGLWTLCTGSALAGAGPGDSGGTVFIPYPSSISSSVPRAVGTVNQGSSTRIYYSTATLIDGAFSYQYQFIW